MTNVRHQSLVNARFRVRQSRIKSRKIGERIKVNKRVVHDSYLGDSFGEDFRQSVPKIWMEAECHSGLPGINHWTQVGLEGMEQPKEPQQGIKRCLCCLLIGLGKEIL